MKVLTREEHETVVRLTRQAIAQAKAGNKEKAEALLADARKISENAKDVSADPGLSAKDVSELIKSETDKVRQELAAAGRMASRRGEFELSDALHAGASGIGITREFAYAKLIEEKTTDQKVKELQKLNDEIFIASKLLGKSPNQFSNSDMIWKVNQYRMLADEMVKAMTISSGSGNEWVPTAFSADLMEMVELELRVAALHDRFPMPTSPYTWPVLGGHAKAYRSQAAGTDDPVKMKASTPTTKNITFTAQKIHVRVPVDTEITEDSIIPILPFLRVDIAYAMALAVEDATVNGDNSAIGSTLDVTDLHGDTINAQSPSQSWDGYRRIVAGIAGMTVDNAGGAKATLQNSLRAIRATMGKYGVDVSRLAYITSVRGHSKLLKMPDYQTLEKIGPRAVILTGQVGFVDGIPLVISPSVRSDLTGGGVSGGKSGATMSMVSLVHRPSFKFGTKRDVTVKSAEDINRDQINVVVTQRMDFQCLYGTAETCIAEAYDV